MVFAFYLYSLFLLLHARRPDYRGHAVYKLRSEQNVGVVEHAILQGHYQELGPLEVGLQPARRQWLGQLARNGSHCADVLGVGEVEGSVDLVEDVHRCRLEQEQSEH